MHCLNERLGEIIVPVKMQVTRDRTERPHGRWKGGGDVVYMALL